MNALLPRLFVVLTALLPGLGLCLGAILYFTPHGPGARPTSSITFPKFESHQAA